MLGWLGLGVVGVVGVVVWGHVLSPGIWYDVLRPPVAVEQQDHTHSSESESAPATPEEDCMHVGSLARATGDDCPIKDSAGQ